MKITINLLKERHQFWLDRIHQIGIWNKNLFKPIDFAIRYNNKSYEGLFHRKYIKSNTKLIMSTGINGNFYDRIILYQNKSEYTLEEIDNTLVHEMIHQYIIQNNMIDSSSHGTFFKSIMDKINCEFFGELNITIKGEKSLLIGEGIKIHKLLILVIDEYFYVCKIKESKIYDFNSYILKNQIKLKIKKFEWFESKNMYFENMRECLTRLHGIKNPLVEFDKFIKTYNLIKKPIIEDLI